MHTPHGGIHYLLPKGRIIHTGKRIFCIIVLANEGCDSNLWSSRTSVIVKVAMGDVVGIIFRARRVKLFLIGIILGLLSSQIIYQFIHIHGSALVSRRYDVAVNIPEIIVVRQVTSMLVRVIHSAFIHGINQEFHPFVVDIRYLNRPGIDIFATNAGGVEGRLYIPAYLAGILNIIGMEGNDMSAVVAVAVEYFLESDNNLSGSTRFILLQRVRPIVGLNFGLYVICPVDIDVVYIIVVAEDIEIGHV